MTNHRYRRILAPVLLVLALSSCASHRSYVFVPDRDPTSPPIEDTSHPENWTCGRVELWLRADFGPVDKLDVGHVCRDDQGQR